MLILSAAGCMEPGIPGSGASRTEVRDISDVDRVSIRGAGKLNIQCNENPSLEITTDDNLLNLISTTVQDRQLQIQSEQRINPTVGPNYLITTGQLRELKTSGSASVTAGGIDTDDFQIHAAGSGSFTVSGTADVVRINIAGSGKADLTQLIARSVRVDVAGSGSVRVNASETLDISIAGSGSVRYIGNPQVSQSIAGSASIKQISEVRPEAEKSQAGDVQAEQPEVQPEDSETDSQ